MRKRVGVRERYSVCVSEKVCERLYFFYKAKEIHLRIPGLDGSPDYVGLKMLIPEFTHNS